MRNQNKLLIQQLDRKLKPLVESGNIQIPERGWIHTIRVTLKMTLRQLGSKLNITSQGVRDIEKREVAGSISIKSLKEVGKALDMKFVYGFVPASGSFENYVALKASELATKIVLRTSQNMNLEGQGNSNDRLVQSIEELKVEIIREMPKSLWN
ncbi:MAG: mobile mystery protein A [Bacteroidetes bacterium]|nr:mobile mystery protein A [Bacteroidota bacterium]